MFLTVAAQNTHILLPEFISAETLQAFNNAAAQLKEEVSETTLRCGKSNPFRPRRCRSPRLSLKNRNLHRGATGENEGAREQGARK